jgi:hypothetical protein
VDDAPPYHAIVSPSIKEHKPSIKENGTAGNPNPILQG